MKELIMLIIVIVLLFLLAFPLMWLWNWLMPDIFGLIEINYWQALGLNILSGILIRSSTYNNAIKTKNQV